MWKNMHELQNMQNNMQNIMQNIMKKYAKENIELWKNTLKNMQNYM